MSEEGQYTIGAEVTCNDGACGRLTRVVIDPVLRALTHIVVEPRSRSELGRLVPVDLVEETAGQIRLRCSVSEFNELEDAEELRFLSEAGEQMGYAGGEMLAWPYYGLNMGTGIDMDMGMTAAQNTQYIADRVPVGEVEILRGDQVHASDGSIGQIQGLVIDPKDHHVTHVLLQEGHLWGKKQVAIPIGAVEEVSSDGVRLSLSRDEVRELPPVEVDRRE
jgi:sporulation protein YlmC with PRC-barrel domain